VGTVGGIDPDPGRNPMGAVLVSAVCRVVILLILAVAAVIIVRIALGDTESKDRARILTAVAAIIRALWSKR
jgi:cytochrome b